MSSNSFGSISFSALTKSIKVSFYCISCFVLQLSIISFVKFMLPFSRFICSTMVYSFGGSSFTFLLSDFVKTGCGWGLSYYAGAGFEGGATAPEPKSVPFLKRALYTSENKGSMSWSLSNLLPQVSINESTFLWMAWLRSWLCRTPIRLLMYSLFPTYTWNGYPHLIIAWSVTTSAKKTTFGIPESIFFLIKVAAIFAL